MTKTIDEKGFLNEDGLLVIYFPAWKGYEVFKVVSRPNKGFERIDYGPGPFVTASGTGIVPAATIDPTSTVPVIPGYTSIFTFTNPALPPEYQTDMWYFVEDDVIYDVNIYYRPALLRCYQYVPLPRQQVVFRTVTANPAYDFGYFRGFKNQIFIPRLHIGWQLANKTNIALVTYFWFDYAEYQVEVPKDPTLIYDAITGRVPAKRFTFGGNLKFEEDPFIAWAKDPDRPLLPVPLRPTREETISAIQEYISKAKNVEGR